MRRAVGPILTTGVALAAAAVVVANPIISTRADVQIPAVALVGSDDVASMLDQSFLDAIAPAPPKSTNPFSVLKDLITSLAADATDLGKSAIVGAFVAGLTAVSEPELTAASVPYLFPDSLFGGESPAAIVSVLPGLDIPAVSAAMSSLPKTPDLTPLSAALASLPDPRGLIADDIAPAVSSLVNTLVDDVGYVGREFVVAAFAAGAAVAAQPGLIVETVVALAKGDLKGAISKAITVVMAPLGPTVIVVDALRTVVENRLADLPGLSPRSGAPGPTATVGADVEADVESEAAERIEPVRAPRSIAPVSSPLAESADISAATSRSEARGQLSAVSPVRRAAGVVREAVEAAADEGSAAVPGPAAAVDDTGERSERAGRGASATGDAD